MCGLSLDQALPLRSARAWLAGWKRVNSKSISEMISLARSKVAKLGADEVGKHGFFMLDTPWEDWLFSLAEVHFTKPGCSAQGFWHEPPHSDGGGSVLHLSLTYFGRRDTRFSLAPGAGPDVFVHSHPGYVYFGAFTGSRHQVVHCAAPPHELLRAGPEELAVTIQSRTALFPYFRGRNRETTPNPAPVFHSLAWAFSAALANLPWRLPSVAVVLEEFARLPGGQVRGRDEEDEA